ncbi:MAG: hypothetical protein ABEH64_01445 [Salinirussus sp.]
MIVVATEDFELYHGAVTALRDRDLDFTTITPEAPLPDATTAVLADRTADLTVESDIPVVRTDADEVRAAIETLLARLRDGTGRLVIGIDPGDRPGIVVLRGGMVVATFQVPPDRVGEVVAAEIRDAENPLVRVGDGARLVGARLVEDLPDVPVELVDETGTTPYLGTGTRGMDDVLAAVNIAQREGDRVDERTIEPTTGELQRIKDRSRAESETNRAIDDALARRVASGDLTIAEALAKHRNK